MIPVDYKEPKSLCAAVNGHSAIIAALPMDENGIAAQHALLDACLSTGVPRFVPSAFGSDTTVALTASLPVYAGKVDIQRRLETLSESNSGALEWTSITCGPYLDWCIMVGLFLDIKAHKVTYYDGGDVPFSATTLAHVGDALVRSLEQWHDIRNRIIRVHDGVFTQRQLVKVAQKLQAAATSEDQGSIEWIEEHASTSELEHAARAKLAAGGELGFQEAYDFIKRAIWGEGYGADMTGTVDNEVLGLSTVREEELEQIIRRYC